MSASYEARAIGIETVMFQWEAKHICPQLISPPCYCPKYEVIFYIIFGIKDWFRKNHCSKFNLSGVFLVDYDIRHKILNVY